MYIDSHCHLNFTGLSDRLPEVLSNMLTHQVDLALAISVSRDTFTEVLSLAEQHDCIYASVGIHPDEEDTPEFSFDELVERARHPKVVGIGETGLDYHWCQGDLTWQKNRFITHIQASNETGLPLIVHTREAGADTLALLQGERVEQGVIHCFTEDMAFAKTALDMGLYLSFSGIVTFKNAKAIQEVAKYVPADRLIIETDAPFLAPTPFRGKPNEPAYVRYVGEFIAGLREDTPENIAHISSENFYRLFNKIPWPE